LVYLDVLTENHEFVIMYGAEIRTWDLLNTKRSVNYVSVVTNVICLSRIPEVPTSNLYRGPIILRFFSLSLWLYSPLDLGRFFNFFIRYTADRTPSTEDQPVARTLHTHRTTQIQNKRGHRHPCLEWDSNTRSQRSSGRRRFMP
jgi:hypothetical protein